jgi:hypothetical protein
LRRWSFMAGSSVRRVFVALLVVTAVSAPLIIAPNAAAAKNRYGVVIVHEPGDTAPAVQCVAISSERIRAIDLLNRTNFDLYTTAFAGLGRSICLIDGAGHGTGEPCFDFDGDGDGDPNWGVWLQKRNWSEPRRPSAGVSSLLVPMNSVLYLHFAPDSGFPDYLQDPPAEVSLRSICSDR